MSVHLPLCAAALMLVVATASCGNDPVSPPTVRVLEQVSGNAQEGRANRALPLPLKVRITDDGVPVPGVGVTWKTADGSLTPSGATDAEGIASAMWTLPSRGGSVKAEARLEGDEAAVAVFDAESHQLVLETVGGDGQSGTAGVQLAEPLQVRVTYEGQPIEGEAVRWSILSQPVVTDANGVASASWAPTTVGEQAWAQLAEPLVPRLYFTASVAPAAVAALEIHWAGEGSYEQTYWTHGSMVTGYATAFDAYGNSIDDLHIDWRLVEGKGTFEESAWTEGSTRNFSLRPADDYEGDVVVRASAGNLQDSSSPHHFASFIIGDDAGGWVDSAFPDSATVPQGGTVRWAYYGNDKHSIGPRGGPVSVSLSTWGQVVERTFNVAGVYEWVCAEHNWERFTITVTP